MKRSVFVVIGLCVVLAACGKKAQVPKEPSTDASTSSAQATAATLAAPAEDSPEAQERARKQAALDFANMEDQFLNDSKGQWGSTAEASSSYNESDDGEGSPDFGSPRAATGAPDSTAWTPKQTQIGIDWIEVQFAKPVTATELRMVITDGVGSVSKIEVVDTDGKMHTAWSGVDEMQADARGNRTWYVTKLEPASYKVAGARYSFAHALNQSNKYVDAIQVVGD